MKIEKAIEILESGSWSGYDDEEIAEAVRMGAEALKNQRPKGEWILTGEKVKYGGYCSKCKCDMPTFIDEWQYSYKKTKFCPNCGADMRKKRMKEA